MRSEYVPGQTYSVPGAGAGDSFGTLKVKTPGNSTQNPNTLVPTEGDLAFRIRPLGPPSSDTATNGADAVCSMRWLPMPLLVERVGARSGDKLVVVQRGDVVPLDGARFIRIVPSVDTEQAGLLKCDYVVDFAQSPADASFLGGSGPDDGHLDFEMPLSGKVRGDPVGPVPGFNNVNAILNAYRVFPHYRALRFGGCTAGSDIKVFVADPGTLAYVLAVTLSPTAPMLVFDLSQIAGGAPSRDLNMLDGQVDVTQASRIYLQSAALPAYLTVRSRL